MIRAAIVLVLATSAATARAQEPAPPRARLELVHSGALESAPMPPVAASAPPGLALSPRLVPPRQWTRVCEGPCQTTVDPARLYRVGGASLFPSPPFRAPANATAVRVDVDPGHKALYFSGVAMTIVGVLTTIGSITALVITKGATGTSETPSGQRWELITAFGGPALVVGGGILWAQNRETLLGVSYY